ncbi:MAG: anhydro-N-acetylmuramic acid kinase, partial [Gammaproteobacteria bacterium]
MHEYYIGLMSGTSMDAVDAVLVDFADDRCQLIATHREPMPEAFKQSLALLSIPSENELNRFGILDQQLGLLFARTVNHLLEKQQLSPNDITAIGSHGQTARHQPSQTIPFTLQIADPNMIAEHTNITTIADFRRRDVASGGQGAPLTPLFHAYAFRNAEKNRVILNLGGIANLTLLPKDQSKPIVGFDTGPANTLLDNWAKQHLLLPYDANGDWSSSGELIEDLLNACLDDAYFFAEPPKSTGPEYFNLNWLQEKLKSSYKA